MFGAPSGAQILIHHAWHLRFFFFFFFQKGCQHEQQSCGASSQMLRAYWFLQLIIWCMIQCRATRSTTRHSSFWRVHFYTTPQLTDISTACRKELQRQLNLIKSHSPGSSISHRSLCIENSLQVERKEACIGDSFL